MKIKDLSLAEIVTAKPEAAALLENYNLDFCCRGKQKLSEALSHDAARLEEVTNRLEKLFEKEISFEEDFTRYSLTELVDHILINHHSYVKANLPVIQRHLEKVTLKHHEAHPEMVRIKVLFDEIKRDFEQHMMKEEVILFPRIKVIEKLFKEGSALKETISIQTPVQVMEAEHQRAGEVMEEIKKLSNCFNAPENACMTYRLCFDELKMFEKDLHQHVHLENNILFPEATAMLSKLNGQSLN